MNTIPDAFSIIVLFHSGKPYLEACLDSLVKTIRANDEILVIINNIDEREHNVSFHTNRVKYIHYYENLGHAKAANFGVEKAQNDYIIISDHDLVYFSDWLQPLWNFYCSDIDLKAVSCKIISVCDNSIQDFGIASSDYNFAHPHRGLPLNHSLVQRDRYAQMICSGGFLIHKKIFHEIGGFNAEFGTLYTDLDICLRLKSNGYKVGVSSQSVAYHFGDDLTKKEKLYKRQHLKADVKGVFMKNNASVIENDIEKYYKESFDFFLVNSLVTKEYFICNCMSVVNYFWYEELLKNFGLNSLGNVYSPTSIRDADYIDIFSILGYNIMALGTPIVYFVDIFSSIRNNAYWWQERKSKYDIVIDRNANIMTVKDMLQMQLNY
jgi:GT2 family glycosyltransferase